MLVVRQATPTRAAERKNTQCHETSAVADFLLPSFPTAMQAALLVLPNREDSTVSTSPHSTCALTCSRKPLPRQTRSHYRYDNTPPAATASLQHLKPQTAHTHAHTHAHLQNPNAPTPATMAATPATPPPCPHTHLQAPRSMLPQNTPLHAPAAAVPGKCPECCRGTTLKA